MAFEIETARQMLTLAAIANVGMGRSLGVIKQDIISELGVARYATRGQWSLAWGPIIAGREDNLVYVAKHNSQSRYAIVLRGTVMKSLPSLWEDIPKGQSAYPFSGAVSTRVSTPFLEALRAMLACPDSNGVRLGDFLDACANADESLGVTVTGHSQGGALAPMLLGWLLQRAAQWRVSGGVSIACYASAPPTSGGPAFAQWLGAQGVSFQIINPLDTVPYWYGAIRKTLTDNVPEALGHTVQDEALRYLTLAWADVADLSGPWAQPETCVRLGSVQLPTKISFIEQAQNQHAHNSYLYLLGAPPVDCTPPSLLPPYGPPRPV